MKTGWTSLLLVYLLSLASACRTGRDLPRENNHAGPANITAYNGIASGKKYDESLKLRKATLDVTVNGNEENASASIGIIRDSVIVVSVIPVAGIEALRIYCTRDSLTVINRSDKTYNISALDRINEKYGIKVDFSILQAILSNEFFLYSGTGHETVTRNRPERSEQNRILEYISGKSGEDVVVQKIFYDGNGECLQKVSITDYTRNVSLEVDYLDFTLTNGIKFPQGIHMSIEAPGNKISITIKADKIEFNERVRIREYLPSGYERMEI